ncbi:MAG: IclR family KDG regulon transcriptional repressor [Cellvibrionaceae bacterium]
MIYLIYTIIVQYCCNVATAQQNFLKFGVFMLGTIRKTGDILELFGRDAPEWGVSEVSERLGSAKSSTHDLMSSLAEIGLLQQTDKGRYRLGWKLVDLGQTLLATTELRAVARPVLEELSAEYRESIQLGLMDAGMVIYLDKVEGKQPIRVELNEFGPRIHPHCTAIGKILLAGQPWSQIEEIVTRNELVRMTENTITHLEQLKIEVARVREEGFAFDMEEMMLDLCCVAAPVRDFTGRIVAAISQSVPAYRFQRSRNELRRGTVNAAHQISRRLGYYR